MRNVAERIEIPGWHFHRFPYKVTINPQDRSRGCQLVQKENYTCGPLTAVKFVDSLFRLSINHNIRFTDCRAKQWIQVENWNVLKKSISFDTLICSNKRNNRAWNQKSPDGKKLLVRWRLYWLRNTDITEVHLRSKGSRTRTNYLFLYTHPKYLTTKKTIMTIWSSWKKIWPHVLAWIKHTSGQKGSKKRPAKQKRGRQKGSNMY
jgi:hypothetical protein